VKECFKGILVEKMANGEGIIIYTNKREALKRAFIKAKVTFRDEKCLIKDYNSLNKINSEDVCSKQKGPMNRVRKYHGLPLIALVAFVDQHKTSLKEQADMKKAHQSLS
jgi:hypothetical protein